MTAVSPDRPIPKATPLPLEKIAQSLGLTLGSLLVQARELSHDQAKQPTPKVDPRYLDRTVTLPSVLPHDQLDAELAQATEQLKQRAATHTATAAAA